jgi:phosphopantothenoylcysteine decarboxylase/phosphopantothenate--cysteine ligase
MKKILLIVTGSIAAYKAIDLARMLENEGFELSIILTNSAKEFVSIPALSAMCKAKVYTDDVFAKESGEWMAHINLGKNPDLVVVAPATADFIAKMNIGLADSLALSALLVTKSPIIVAPAMNPSMLSHSATDANIKGLKQKGVIIAEPIYGMVACKDVGYGKYIGHEALLEIINSVIGRSQKLKGKKAVITLGSTRENFDPVRFIGNYSTGKQGALIAEELLSHGCEVTIISGYIDVELPNKANVIKALNAEDMFNAASASLPADIFIGCAAICDFKPKTYSPTKIKKTGGGLVIELEPNIDVIKTISALENRPKLMVGFSLETNDYTENAKKKLQAKNLDVIVLNKAENLGQEQNEFSIITANTQNDLGEVSKIELAKNLVEEVIKRC